MSDRLTAQAAATAPIPVSVLGLGRMGSALAAAFLRAGHPTTVWNRTAGKSTDLVTEGAIPAASPGQAVAASPVVVVCVLDDAVVHALLDEAAKSMTGRTIVNLTTSTPAQARRLAEWATAHRARYLDGGIMATPDMIGGPDAYLLLSGSAQALETARPAIGRLGDLRYLGDDPGMASLYDLALLAGMYGMLGGWFQALAVVSSAGIAAGGFAELLGRWLDAMATYLPEIAEQLDTRDDTPDVSPMVTHTSALTNIIAAGNAQGIGGQLLGPLRDLFARASTEGAPNLAHLVGLLAMPTTGSAGDRSVFA